MVTRKSCTGQEAKPRPCFWGQGVPVCTLNIKLPQKQPPDSRQSAESSTEQTGHDPDNPPGFLLGISGGSCCQPSSFPSTWWALPTAQVAARSRGGPAALMKALIPSPRAESDISLAVLDIHRLPRVTALSFLFHSTPARGSGCKPCVCTALEDPGVLSLSTRLTLQRFSRTKRKIKLESMQPPTEPQAVEWK